MFTSFLPEDSYAMFVHHAIDGSGTLSIDAISMHHCYARTMARTPEHINVEVTRDSVRNKTLHMNQRIYLLHKLIA